jgi:hypothetical protein
MRCTAVLLAAVAAAAGAAPVSPPFRGPINFPIVDGHVHVTNMSEFQYTWTNPALAGGCPCAPPCPCNWTPADYAAVSSGSALPTSKFVFIEVSAVNSFWLEEAQWVQVRGRWGGGAPCRGFTRRCVCPGGF